MYRSIRSSPSRWQAAQHAAASVPTRLRGARSAAAITLLAFACAASFATTSLATAPPANESLAIFERQLHGHQVSAVTLGTKAHIFRVTLQDSRVVRVVFPSAEQQRLVNDINATGITVKVAKPQSSPSHKRRYIIGGVVIVVIVLAVVGLLLMRRRRMREEE